MATQTQFTDFLHDIEPSRTTKSDAQKAHEDVRKFLKEHETFKEVRIRDFLSGSYKRNTAIRPKTEAGEIERPDVDIAVVTSHGLGDKPAEVLDLVYKALSDGYKDIRRQPRSVGLSTSSADMDVVPLIQPNGGTMYIPDRKLEEWLETNPEGHTDWTTEQNKEADGRFKPLVKLMKWWRRENPTVSKRPKGFVIECFTAECMSYIETQYAELFVGTLEEIVDRYRSYIDTQLVPSVSDPSVSGNSVTTGLTFAAFEGFYNKVAAHATLGRQALGEDAEKATELWWKIFGSRFPKIEATAKSLTASATKIAPLTFPNHPVRPNRPEGFA